MVMVGGAGCRTIYHYGKVLITYDVEYGIIRFYNNGVCVMELDDELWYMLNNTIMSIAGEYLLEIQRKIYRRTNYKYFKTHQDKHKRKRNRNKPS